MITGGPSSGKTAVVRELEKRGFFCIHELVRSMTAAQKNEHQTKTFVTNPILTVEDPAKFNQMLLDGRIAQFGSAEKSEREIVFFDRGIPDVHAYMNCFGQGYDAAFERPAYRFRYDCVLLMPPWREIYTTDAERFESYAESERIFTALDKTYRAFGYKTIPVPKTTVSKRTDFILDVVNAD